MARGVDLSRRTLSRAGFDEDLASIESVESEWELYDALSPKMMATLKPKAPVGLAQSAKRVAAKILQFPGSQRSE